MAYGDDDDTDELDRTISRRDSATTADIVNDKRAQSRRQSTTRILSVSLIVIAILYLAKPVVVPIALAILFAFLLSPIVSVLERTFLRRAGAITLALGLSVMSLGFGGWWIYQQLNLVAQEVSAAAASKNIEAKLRFLRRSSGGTFDVFERTLQRVADARDTPENADLKVRVIRRQHHQRGTQFWHL